jgi:hypothetical protein
MQNKNFRSKGFLKSGIGIGSKFKILIFKIMAVYLVERLTFFRKEIFVFPNMTDSFLPRSFLSSGMSRGVAKSFEPLKIKALANLIKACLQNIFTK